MRIAIGQFWQESNTLNPIPTTRADFEAFGICEGAELIERFAETNELGGFIQSLRGWLERPEIVPLMRFAAWPGGPVDADTFAFLIDSMLAALDRAGHVDAVLLALHGSMVAQCEPDVEGHLLERMRAPGRARCSDRGGARSARQSHAPHGRCCRCFDAVSHRAPHRRDGDRQTRRRKRCAASWSMASSR